ncbi:MAG: twin-arginine translocase subunit TatC [Syntrophales bacterium]|jgi:sec-independent protein translocase protein TatC|nr:twin-arginine translocase subunit TatC [Syntrophales bacterium]
MENDHSEEEKLPLTSHLEELKTRLIRILVVVGVGFGVCYLFKDWSFRVITRPLVDAMPAQSSMIFTGLPEAFFIHMKIAFFASLFLTAPYTLFEIWRFVSPGLYKNEKRFVFPFLFFSTLLFIGGVLFGYFIALPPAFRFFVSFSTDFLKPMISFREYLGLTLKFLLAFGLCFEMPVFIFFLAKLGVVNAKMLSKQRRYAILIIFIAAAILTPSPDVISQILMAIPLMILYEVSIFVAKFAQRKKPAAEETEDEEKEESGQP